MLGAMRTARLSGWLLSLLVLAGCPSAPSTDDAAPEDAGSADGGHDGGVDAFVPRLPPDITRTMGEAALAPMREGCAFEAGAWPAETLGTEFPIGDDIPIDHVIVIMQENRSFDHYLGRLVAQGYYDAGDFSPGGTGFDHDDQLDGPPAGWSNPDGAGGTVVPHPDDAYCYGVNHSWNDMHADWHDGANDGFVINNEPGGARSFFYEDDTVLPFYYALADRFSVGDRYFCSVLTSTWPNRLYMMAATSFGNSDNSFVTTDTRAHPANNLFLELQQAGRTWGDYTDGPHQVLFLPNFGGARETQAHFGDVQCDPLTAIQTDTLPDVAFMMGNEVTGTSDEGPSNLPGIGGLVVENLIRALFASPAWAHTAVFITYDENGGLADHVPPPAMCPPDALEPHDGHGVPATGHFDRAGFRVPFIVVSPYARAHHASHVVYDHTSVVRFIEARFGLPAMTARDANATPPMDMFDFDAPPFMTPPTIDAHTTVPDAILMQCRQSYAPFGCASP
jgi:phospholipase C